MRPPTYRRRFLRSASVASAALAVRGFSRVVKFPLVSAAEAQVRPDMVRFDQGLEPTVRLLEDTPGDALIEQLVVRIRTGLAYRELMAALLLAGVLLQGCVAPVAIPAALPAAALQGVGAPQSADTPATGAMRSLLHEARDAAAQFHDLDAAFEAGYSKFQECLTLDSVIGRGRHYVQHYVHGDLAGDDLLDPAQPEALVYETLANGRATVKWACDAAATPACVGN